MTSKLKPEHVVAVVDTREQRPWDLAPLQTITGTLATGDYTVRGLEHVVCIERKSLQDLLSCVGRERARFDREVQRLLSYPTRALIVESTWGRIESGEWRSQVHSSAVIGSLLGWMARGLPVILAGNRERAGKFAARLLYTVARRRWDEMRTLEANSACQPMLTRNG